MQETVLDSSDFFVEGALNSASTKLLRWVLKRKTHNRNDKRSMTAALGRKDQRVGVGEGIEEWGKGGPRIKLNPLIIKK